LKEYKEVQIIKHALMNYIKRPEATDKEIEQEKQLLQYYTERAERLKQRFRIRCS
jgi:hypothetical protein